MFGFEGLGCIYWHMVSKLLLAVQENFFAAAEGDVDSATLLRLGALYYRVREGLGFNKTPSEYGAFPTDPYSHTTGHSGARQPGMTGQVKEEILTRFGELGVRVADGVLSFDPSLLRRREFLAEPGTYRYLPVDGDWEDVDVPVNGLAFSFCQVAVIEPLILRVNAGDCVLVNLTNALPADLSGDLFDRNGRIHRLTVSIRPERLFSE